MPRGDRTGPTGAGPRTGRAAGYCSGSDVPGYANPYPRGGRGPGFGRGRGFGGGRGWRNRYYATGLPGWMRAEEHGLIPPDTEAGHEKRILEKQAERLEAELGRIKAKLSKFKSEES